MEKFSLDSVMVEILNPIMNLAKIFSFWDIHKKENTASMSIFF